MEDPVKHTNHRFRSRVSGVENIVNYGLSCPPSRMPLKVNVWLTCYGAPYINSHCCYWHRRSTTRPTCCVQSAAVIQLVPRRCPATHWAAVVPTLMDSCVSVSNTWLGVSVTRVKLDTGTCRFTILTDVKVFTLLRHLSLSLYLALTRPACVWSLVRMPRIFHWGPRPKGWRQSGGWVVLGEGQQPAPHQLWCLGSAVIPDHPKVFHYFQH